MMSTHGADVRQIINGLEALGEFLGLGRDYIFNLQREGQLPPAILLPGRKTPLFLVGDVMAWLESHRTTLPATYRTRRGRPKKREQKATREAAA